MNWTPKTTAQLCQAWGDNGSFGSIARQFGTTRNAIGGKLNRLRLEGALTEADARRGPKLNRMEQVAEWMAEHDGRICDMARALNIPRDQALKAWQRVVKAMGAQAA